MSNSQSSDIQNNNSILSGFGMPSKVNLDIENASFLFSEPPQATSTQGIKKSRQDLEREYVTSLDITPQKMASKTNRMNSRNNLQSFSEHDMSEFQLINVDSIAGLSNSMLLLDPSDSSKLGLSENCRSKNELGKHYFSDCDSVSPEPDVKLTAEDLATLETDFTTDDDFSDGEMGVCKNGPELAFENMLESKNVGLWQLPGFRSANVELSQKEMIFTPVKNVRGENVDNHLMQFQKPGNDSMKYQQSETNTRHELADHMGSIVRANLTQSDSVCHPDIWDGEKSFEDEKQMSFNEGQISGRSTSLGLAGSKLFSSSINSLGSFGKGSERTADNSFSSEQLEDECCWLKGDQPELVNSLQDEDFGTAGGEAEFFNELEEDEKKLVKEDAFTVAGERQDLSWYPGIHDEEITVRPSWVSSPFKDQIRPGNRMSVTTYLMGRSEPLGSLGDGCGKVEKPTFGLPKSLYSPPAAPSFSFLENKTSEHENWPIARDTLSKTYCKTLPTLQESSNQSELEPAHEKCASAQSSEHSNCSSLPKPNEESSSYDQAEFTRSLERTLREAGHIITSVTSYQIRELVSQWQGNPQDLVSHILKMLQKPTTPSLDVTDMDVSLEVLELRRQREALGRRVGNANDSPVDIPLKHKVKLQAMCHNSAPQKADQFQYYHSSTQLPSTENLRLNYLSKENSDQIPSLETPPNDETVIVPKYNSISSGEVPHSQLPTYANAGVFDHSTPHVPKITDLAKTQGARPRVRMGTGKVQPTKMAMSNSGSHRSFLDGLGEMPHISSQDLQLSRSVSEPMLEAASQNVTLGIASVDSEDKTRIKLPTTVTFPSTLVGIESRVTFYVHNPFLFWVQLVVQLVKESINNSSTLSPILSVKPSIFLEPGQDGEVVLYLRSSEAGAYQACLETKAVVLGSSFRAGGVPNLGHQFTTVVARLEQPQVAAISNGKDFIDFGIVPEGCCIQQEIMLVNKSMVDFSVLLHLPQKYVHPLFVWDATNNSNLCVVKTPILMMQQLPAEGTVTVFVVFQAPYLNPAQVGVEGLVDLSGELKVEFQTYESQKIIIGQMLFKAVVGAIKLRSSPRSEPLLFETSYNAPKTDVVPLRNSSSFKLNLSLYITSEEGNAGLFTVSPTAVEILPNQIVSPVVMFHPSAVRACKVASTLKIRVEPNGTEYEVSLLGFASSVPNLTGVEDVTSSGTHVLGGTKFTSSKISPDTSTIKVPSLPSASSIDQGSSSSTSGIHSSLNRCLSDPVKPQLAKIDPETALVTNRSQLIFGTVAEGQSAVLSVVLRNNSNEEKLKVLLGFSTQGPFKLCDPDGQNSMTRKEITMEPCGECTVYVVFAPVLVASYQCKLLLKPTGLMKAFKFTIILQGHGGKAVLSIPSIGKGNSFIVHDIIRNESQCCGLIVSNIGSRAAFIVMRLFADDKCAQILPDNFGRIYPDTFVLCPGVSRDVSVFIKGETQLIAQLPGVIGLLQVISGDEILRQRFRRIRSRSMKSKRLLDASLIDVNFDMDYLSQRDAETEIDDLPVFKDDAIAFYNACSKTQIELFGELKCENELSSTMFVCLPSEETMTSFLDDMLTQDRSNSANTGNYALNSELSSQVFPVVHQQVGPSSAWQVLPEHVTFAVGATHTVIYIVNSSQVDLQFEVKSAFDWLKIEPQEVVVMCNGNVKINLMVDRNGLLKTETSDTISGDVMVTGENESRIVKVTIEGVLKEQGKKIKAASTAEINPNVPSKFPIVPKKGFYTNCGTSHCSGQTVLSQPKPVKPSQIIGAVVNKATSAGGKIAPSSSQQPTSRSQWLEVETNSVIFPSAAIGSQKFIKILIKNLDSLTHTVDAQVKGDGFSINHFQPIIREKGYARLPVYFRPLKKGEHHGLLTFSEATQASQEVKLIGEGT